MPFTTSQRVPRPYRRTAAPYATPSLVFLVAARMAMQPRVRLSGVGHSHLLLLARRLPPEAHVTAHKTLPALQQFGRLLVWLTSYFGMRTKAQALLRHEPPMH